MSSIVVIATCRVLNEEDIPFVKKEFLRLYETVRTVEKGWTQYDFHQEVGDESIFVFIETWESLEALEKHMIEPHFLEFVAHTSGKIEVLGIKKFNKIEC